MQFSSDIPGLAMIALNHSAYDLLTVLIASKSKGWLKCRDQNIKVLTKGLSGQYCYSCSPNIICRTNQTLQSYLLILYVLLSPS